MKIKKLIEELTKLNPEEKVTDMTLNCLPHARYSVISLTEATIQIMNVFNREELAKAKPVIGVIAYDKVENVYYYYDSNGWQKIDSKDDSIFIIEKLGKKDENKEIN